MNLVYNSYTKFINLKMTISNILLPSFMFAVLMYLCVDISRLEEMRDNQKCNVCLYNKCPSDYLTSFCSRLQTDNDCEQRSYIQNITSETNGLSEIDKLSMYSRLYGSNMKSCILSNRQVCMNDFCASECYYREKKNLTSVDGLTPTRNPIVDSVSTREYRRLANSDDCFLNNANFRDIYGQCHISLFRDKCIDQFTEEVKSQCS